MSSCDEFVFYEDLIRSVQEAPPLVGLPKKQKECFALLADSIKALMREGKEVLWGSMIKQTMQRKRPEFNEEYFGYSAFSALLEDAEKHHVVKLRRDQRSGTYVVTGFDAGSGEAVPGAAEAEPAGEAKSAEKSRRPRRRPRKSSKTPGEPSPAPDAS